MTYEAVSPWNSLRTQDCVSFLLHYCITCISVRSPRFGIVEGDKNNFCLFTLHNPISSSRKPGYIVKWNTTTYVPEKMATVAGTAGVRWCGWCV